MGIRQDVRSRVAIPASYQADDGLRVATSITDISEYGCRLRKGVEHLRAGTGLSITIDALQPVSARVCWQYGQYCGLSFQRPLASAIVHHLYDRFWRTAAPEKLMQARA